MPSCFNWYLLKAPPTGTLWAPTDTTQEKLLMFFVSGSDLNGRPLPVALDGHFGQLLLSVLTDQTPDIEPFIVAQDTPS